MDKHIEYKVFFFGQEKNILCRGVTPLATHENHRLMVMFGGWTPHQTKTCSLCLVYVIETQTHAFYDCPSVNWVWVLFGNLREEFGLLNVYQDSETILMGAVDDVPSFSKEEEGHWDLTATFSLLDRRPCDVLRNLMVRNIWCLRTTQDMCHEAFQLGVGILRALQTTIHAGMATWE